MDGAWVPISMFIGITIVLCVFVWLRQKGRSDVQTTIRAALDKGQDLTPELIDRLGHPKPAEHRDLRLGIIWVAVAIALVAFGFGIPDDEEDVTRIFMGIASFPAMIGFAYLLLHKVSNRD